MSEIEFPAEINPTAHILYRPRPETPWQALMEASIGCEPETSTTELLALRDVLADAIDGLTPRERWVFNAHFVERRSLRRIGADLGLAKTTIALIRDHAIKKLQAVLMEDPQIRTYLGMENK